ncbi:MAG TPA: hypothetical protein DCF33_13515 [Saprospirales bacterium]|nr:hypothetical protein [Saprospirales bacterium]
MINDPFTLTFHLKQQTPHLHFLHRQAGPTLRITELKAKLDRLIAKHEFQDQFEQAREYLVGYNHANGKRDALKTKWDNEHFRAFDYRMRLDFPTRAEDKQEMWAISTPSAKFGKTIKNESNDDYLAETPYFADNDKTDLLHEDLKKGILFIKPIQLSIFTLHDRLRKALKECLPMLIAQENFGCRQSKGFGSYWLENQSFEEAVKKLIDKGEIQGAWSLRKTFRPEDLNDLFRQISSDYRSIKSGFNHPMDPSKYKKSLLFTYFADKSNIRWEKRKIKQDIQLVRPGILKQNRDPLDRANGKDENYYQDPPGSNYEYKYIRALLGLAEQFEFQSSYGDKIKVKVSHPDIERFKSPITIKVVNGRIYWLALHHQTDNIVGKVFEFSAEQGSTSFFRNTPIAVPTKFDLGDFLQQHLTTLGYSPLNR